MRNSLSAIFLLIFSSCINLKEINSLTPPRGPGRGDEHCESDEQTEEDKESFNLAVFCCGVEVDTSYNWRQDTLAGREQCTLVLYRDSVRVLSFPAGSANEVGVDADEHFILDGEVFTSFTSDNGSVIKRNGEEFLRIQGKARLNSILKHEGHIWTLCCKVDTQGFILHKDAQTVKESSIGTAGPLHQDGDDVCFCHHCPNPSGGRDLWYVCRNGTDIPIQPYTVFSIHSARCHHGEIWSVQQSQDNMAFFKGSTKCSVYKLRGCSLGHCEIEPVDDYCALWASLHYGSKRTNYIWRKNSSHEYADESIFNVFFGMAGTMICLYEPGAGSVGFHQWNSTQTLDGRWMLMGRNCTDLYGNAVAMALSSADGEQAAYSLNTTLHTLNLNGYLTGISLQPYASQETRRL